MKEIPLVKWDNLNINSNDNYNRLKHMKYAKIHEFLIIILKISLVTFRRCSVQFRSVTQLCPTLCDPMDYNIPGLPIHHQLLEFTQTRVHWVGDAIQPSYPLLSPSSSDLNPSQHQGLFQWVSSSHQVAKLLEFQLQHLSFQWVFRADFL